LGACHFPSDGLLMPVSDKGQDAWYKSTEIAFKLGLDGLLKEVESRGK